MLTVRILPLHTFASCRDHCVWVKSFLKIAAFQHATFHMKHVLCLYRSVMHPFLEGYCNKWTLFELNLTIRDCHCKKNSPVCMFHICYSLSNVFILSNCLQKKDAGEGVYEVFLLCCGCLILSVAVEFTFLVCTVCLYFAYQILYRIHIIWIAYYNNVSWAEHGGGLFYSFSIVNLHIQTQCNSIDNDIELI